MVTRVDDLGLSLLASAAIAAVAWSFYLLVAWAWAWWDAADVDVFFDRRTGARYQDRCAGFMLFVVLAACAVSVGIAGCLLVRPTGYVVQYVVASGLFVALLVIWLAPRMRPQVKDLQRQPGATLF